MRKIEDEVIEKMAIMIKSGEPELCNLAASMFTQLSDKYDDYWELRTLVEPNAIFVPGVNSNKAMHTIFNLLNKNTLMEDYNRILKKKTKVKI